MARPLIPIGFSYFGALLIASFLGVTAAAVLALVSFLVAAALLLLRVRRKYPVVFLFAVVFFAAFLVYTLSVRVRVLPVERYAGNTYRAEMEILGKEGKSYGNSRYTARVRRLEETGQNVDFTVRLTHGDALPVEIGDTVRATVRFYEFEDRFGLSTRTSQLADGKTLGAYISDYASVEVVSAEKRPIGYYLEAVRETVRDKILDRFPLPEGSVLTAMLVGLRDDIPDALNEDYRNAGGSHILVISGMHMAIFAQFALSALGLFGMNRRAAAGVSLGFVILFMLVSGMSPSVVRSGFMQILLLFGIVIGRVPDPVNSLAAALLLMTLLNPFCVGDISLLLSFSATLGVVTVSPNLLERVTTKLKDTKKKRVVSAALSPVCASLGAILGAAPVQLYVFGTVHFTGLLTSLLTLYISAWLIRFGIVAAVLLLLPFLAPAASPFVFVSTVLAKAQNAVVHWVAARFSRPPVLAGAYLPAALLIVLLFFFGACAVRKRFSLTATLLSAVLVLFSAALNTEVNRSGTRVLLLDSPYASCTALLHDGDAFVLQCTGNGSTVADALSENGVERLRFLLVNEKEADIRCAEHVAESFPVDAFLLPEAVYFPLAGEDAPRYRYGTDQMLSPDASCSVTAKGRVVTVNAYGRTVVYAGEKALTGIHASPDLLITEDADCGVTAPYTLLIGEASVSDLPLEHDGTYFFSDGAERTLLRFSQNGVRAYIG